MKHLHNELLQMRLDARISNILIFLHHFFHQINKSFYLQSFILNVESVFYVRIRSSENRHARGKVGTMLLPHMQKSRKIQKRIENKQWTYCCSSMSQTCTIFFIFCFVIIRNFNSFCSFFYYCNWPETFLRHANSRHHAN